MFDFAVNSGVGTAKRFLKTSRSPAEFLSKRLRFMTDLGIWPTFGRGWARRIADLVAMLPSGETPKPRKIFLNGTELPVDKATVVNDKWYITTKE